MKAGQLIHIHYELRSSGLPAREVALWSTWSGSGIVPLDAPSRFLGWVAKTSGEMRFLAIRPGTYRVDVDTAGRTGNLAGQVISLTVRQ